MKGGKYGGLGDGERLNGPDEPHDLDIFIGLEVIDFVHLMGERDTSIDRLHRQRG